MWKAPPPHTHQDACIVVNVNDYTVSCFRGHYSDYFLIVGLVLHGTGWAR